MNQILSFENMMDSKEHINKVIKFFSFFIISFAVILIIEGALGYKNFKDQKINIDTPEIKIEKNDGTTILKINSTIGIKKIIYSWNDGEEDIIEKNGETTTEEEIINLIGVNDLNLKIVDVDGNTIKYDPVKIVYEGNNESDETITQPEETTQSEDENWEIAVANDKTKPTISLSSVNGKVIIEASDDVRMSYVVYSWNDGEEIKVTGLSTDEKTLKAEIDTPVGNNKLKIKAYDKAGNVEEKEKDIQKADKPEIKVVRDDDEIIVSVTSEVNITKIDYKFNGEEKTIDNINDISYEFRLNLKDGENFIIVTAYQNDVKSEYKGKTTK